MLQITGKLASQGIDLSLRSDTPLRFDKTIGLLGFTSVFLKKTTKLKTEGKLSHITSYL